MTQKKYDLISIGRSGVDLYGEQFGGRLEDMLSFSKYVGGCPANIAIGTSRLGLDVAILTRVGDEQMGRYLTDTFANNGVDTRYIVIDKERLTTVVLLGIQNDTTFPLLYYRKNCADMGLCEDDIKEEALANSRAILLSGVHLSSKSTAKATFRAVLIAKNHNSKVIFDIDYRPTLWGLTGLGGGESRFVENAEVTANIQKILPDCDMIVGTEEEFNIAGGSTEALESLHNIRKISNATFVYKMGALGCCVIEGEVPNELIPYGQSFAIKILNSVGAGDAFMSGFLAAYLRDKNWDECATYGNAAGALVVTRHGCSPASPSATELDYFIENSKKLPAVPDRSAYFKHLHYATNRAHKDKWTNLHILAFDHRVQFEAMADDAKLDISSKEGSDKIKQAKGIIYSAFEKVRNEYTSQPQLEFGLICDDKYCKDILEKSALSPIWSARAVEKPLTRPLDFDFDEDLGVTIRHFQAKHVIKCLIFHHPQDDESLQQEQICSLKRLYQLSRASRLELLLEILPPDFSNNGLSGDELAASIELIYQNKIYPDWWKLAAMKSQEDWDKISILIKKKDFNCRGVLLLGADKPIEMLKEEFALASRQDICKGYAIGRSIFASACKSWFDNKFDNAQAKELIENNFRTVINNWQSCKK